VTNPSPPTPQAVIALARKACAAYGRTDLAGRLDMAAAQLARPSCRVLVVGEFKKGKSSLVNGLVGTSVCPVDDARPTALPTFLRWQEHESAELVLRSVDGTFQRQPLDALELADRITTSPEPLPPADPDDPAQVPPRPVAVELGMRRRLLGRGIELVDTPGVGGLDSRHAAATRAALADADAVVFVTDATQELTHPELAVLLEAHAQTHRLVMVITKVGLVPERDKVIALDRGHLVDAGLGDLQIFTVSTRLRETALAAGSKDINAESGYAPLIQWLVEVAADHRAAANAFAARDVQAVIDGLEGPFVAERAVLTDPDRAAALVAGLEAAQQRAQQLKAAGRWQQTLGDGVADLNAEVDHDFRERMRSVTAQAEEALAGTDPANAWAEFEPWLYRRVAEDVLANTALLNDRTAELATTVEAHFAEEGGHPADSLALPAPTDTLQRLEGTAAADLKAVGAGATGMTAVRGMQGGVMMFGMLGNLVGLTVAGPAMIGVGLVMGAKAVRDERKRQLTVRQQQGRQAVRKYLDEVSFHVGKDNRDALRRMQRMLRDHFGDRAAEAHRSVAEALEAAKQAVAADRELTPARLADIEAEVARLGALRERVDAALGPAAPAPSDDADDVEAGSSQVAGGGGAA